MTVEVTELVDVVLVEVPVERLEEDVIENDRLSELDTGLLALDVTCRILTMAPCDHVEGAQSLDARTKEMEAKRMTRARDLSGEAIAQTILIDSARYRETDGKREGVKHRKR